MLVGLVLAGRHSDTAPLAEVPFRWHNEDDGVLKFRALCQHIGTFPTSVLKPDAIVEIAHKRRLVIEAETGTQSIVTAHPERTGAIVAKLQRYARFFTSRSFDSCARRPSGQAPRLFRNRGAVNWSGR